MTTDPTIQELPAQPFAAVTSFVTIPFGDVLGPMWSKVYGWLVSKGIEPAGPPFIRYLTTQMDKGLDIQVGIPISAEVQGDDGITTGVLPGGRYAVLLYQGPYDGLYDANSALVKWGESNHITWDTSDKDGVEWWGGRYESYITDPEQEPDPSKWETEVLFRVA